MAIFDAAEINKETIYWTIKFSLYSLNILQQKNIYICFGMCEKKRFERQWVF